MMPVCLFVSQVSALTFGVLLNSTSWLGSTPSSSWPGVTEGRFWVQQHVDGVKYATLLNSVSWPREALTGLNHCRED